MRRRRPEETACSFQSAVLWQRALLNGSFAVEQTGTSDV
jgi:hypothetical protein